MEIQHKNEKLERSKMEEKGETGQLNRNGKIEQNRKDTKK